jgi:hypothetical protein
LYALSGPRTDPVSRVLAGGAKSARDCYYQDMVVLPLLKQLVVAVLAVSPAARHFDVVAAFEPGAKPGSDAAVAVSFRALDPDLKLNETPAPRLKLELTQAVLEDRQPPAAPGVPDYDPATAKYIDTQKPVRFKVAIAKAAPRGPQEVKASVVYFYCSTREQWCRRGTADVLIPVTVP